MPLASPAATFLRYISQPGDDIGVGGQGTITEADGTLFMSWGAGPSDVLFQINGSRFWAARFKAAAGHSLAVGTYDALGLGSWNGPTMDIYGDFRGCDSLIGRFTVLEVEMDASQTLTRFAADFEQHCHNGEPALYGGVRYKSDIPYVPQPPVVPEPAFIQWASDTGDPIGAGSSGTLSHAEGYFNTFPQFGPDVGVRFVGYPGKARDWQLVFVAPYGLKFGPGVYENAGNFFSRSSSVAGISVEGNGHACVTDGGRFIVYEVEYGLRNTLTKFAADFEHRCNGATGTMTGAIRYNSTLPYTPPAKTCTWIGAGASNKWSDPANWLGGNLPVANDHIVFMPSSFADTVNDLSSGPFESVSFDNGVEWRLSGLPLVLAGATPIRLGPVHVTLDVPVRLTHPAPLIETSGVLIFNSHEGPSLELNGALDIHGTPLSPVVQIAGDVAESSPSSIRMTGSGSLAILGASKVSGEHRVTTGGALAVSVGHGDPLGPSWANYDARLEPMYAGTTLVNTRLELFAQGAPPADDAYIFNEQVSIGGTSDASGRGDISTGGNFTSVVIAAPLSINDGQKVILGTPGITIRERLSGNARLLLGGRVTLSNRANTFTGGITVGDRGDLINGASEVIPDTNDLFVGNGGQYRLESATETVNSFTCTGVFYINAGHGLLSVRDASSLFGACALGLTMDDSFSPQPGEVVTLISNQSGRPIDGTFRDLPEGSPIFMGRVPTKITYRGGAGGLDVALVALVIETPPGPPTGPTQLVPHPAVIPVIGWSLFTAAVDVLDGAGRPVPGVAVDFSYSCASACGSGNTYAATDQNGRATVHAVAGATPGSFTINASLGTLSTSITVVVGVPDVVKSYQDMWWAGPAENGWGMSVVQHGDKLFNVIFAYDDAGRPTWFSMPGGGWNESHTLFSGALYSPRSSPFFAYDARYFAPGAAVGTATLSFTERNAATLDYTIDGRSGHKLLTRQPFGAAGQGAHGDMWWGGANQNGWGLAVLEQTPMLFPVWYTYDAAGLPIWYAMPIGEWTSAGIYEGRIYRTASSAWVGQAYDASQLRAFDVGTYRIRFQGDSATFDYAVEGRSGSASLDRQPF